MRRKDKEISDRAVIDSILQEAQICRIAMSLDNLPYLVPVNFGYDGKSIYFHSAKEGKKIEILRENPVVCFEVETKTEVILADVACRCGERYYSVIGMGKAKFLTDMEEKKKALDVIMKKYAGDRKFEYETAEVDRILLIRIEITGISGKKSGY